MNERFIALGQPLSRSEQRPSPGRPFCGLCGQDLKVLNRKVRKGRKVRMTLHQWQDLHAAAGRRETIVFRK